MISFVLKASWEDAWIKLTFVRLSGILPSLSKARSSANAAISVLALERCVWMNSFSKTSSSSERLANLLGVSGRGARTRRSCTSTSYNVRSTSSLRTLSVLISCFKVRKFEETSEVWKRYHFLVHLVLDAVEVLRCMVELE